MTWTPGGSVAVLVVVLSLATMGVTAQSLTAGDIDDHLNWDHYLDYLGSFQQDRQHLPTLDLGDRTTLLIVDEDGDPIGDARVTLTTDLGTIGLRAGMDGIVRVFPDRDGLGGGSAALAVEAPDGTLAADTIDLDVSGPHKVTVDTQAGPATKLDLMFVVDTTGSMSDELRYITRELAGIVDTITTDHGNVDIRYGLTVYRDDGDDYVVRTLGFTHELDTMQGRLGTQRAAGGGDYPEAMDEAVQAAVDEQWRSEGVRLMFLIADAPPHPAGYTRLLDAAQDAREAGIHIHPIAASGVADEAEYLMRASAALTQGRYMFLTDDSGIGNPHAEPRIPCYIVTELSDLMARVVSSEITGTRVEPAPGDILRESGNYEMGVCLDVGQDTQPDQPTDATGDPEASTSAYDDGSGDTGDHAATETSWGGAADDTAASTRTGGSSTSGDDAPGDTGADGSGATGDETDDASEAQPTPGPQLLLLLLGLGAAAAVTRRRC